MRNSRPLPLFSPSFFLRAALMSAVLLAFFGAPPLLSSENKIKEYEKEIKTKSVELKKIEDDIRKKRSARDEEKRKEEIFRKEIKRLDGALAALNSRQQEIKKEIRRAALKLASAQKSLTGARETSALSTEEFKKTVNLVWLSRTRSSLYRPLPRVFEQRDIISFRRAALKDACLKESVCEDQVKKWDSASRELTALEKRLAENLDQQKSLKEEKRKLLSDATARRVAIEEEIQGLAETSRALHDMLDALESRKQATRQEILERARARDGTLKYRGELEWPVRGDIALRFGKNKREDTDTPIISNGIRIKTFPRSAVSAAARGECIFSGNFRSYGQMVVIDHGGSLFTVYGLLDDIAVADGDKVAAGQKIGVAGNGEGIVYFEVRHGGQPVDPLTWLKN